MNAELPIELLCNLGSVVAFRFVKRHQPKASFIYLLPMAAGLKGKGWRDLNEATKGRLRKEAIEQ